MRRGVRLGVDVGSVRVGLAACDPDALVASPVATLARDASGGGDLAEIVRHAAERGAVEVVVGLPLSLSGREGPAAVGARAYAGELHAALGRARDAAPGRPGASRSPGAPVAPAVRLVDERMTTVSAQQAMRAAGRPGRRQRSVVDQVAAVIVLQHALDAERASGWLGELVGDGAPDGAHDAATEGGSRDGADGADDEHASTRGADDGGARGRGTVEQPWTA